jgi:hypothetical protein
METEFPVHRHGRLHDQRNCVQAHTRIAYLARLCDHRSDQSPAHGFSAKLWPHIQPLHFADSQAIRSMILPMQRHTPCKLGFVIRQQQSALGRRVISRKFRQLLIEVLEAKTEAERSGVLEEKLTRLRNLAGRLSLRNR